MISGNMMENPLGLPGICRSSLVKLTPYQNRGRHLGSGIWE
jgi:hypothetical protein